MKMIQIIIILSAVVLKEVPKSIHLKEEKQKKVLKNKKKWWKLWYQTKKQFNHWNKFY